MIIYGLCPDNPQKRVIFHNIPCVCFIPIYRLCEAASHDQTGNNQHLRYKNNILILFQIFFCFIKYLAVFLFIQDPQYRKSRHAYKRPQA